MSRWCPALIAMTLLTAPLGAQDIATGVPPYPRPADVQTVDSIIPALYDVISGPPGQARQWDRMMSLFHPAARLIPTGCNAEGKCGARILTPDEYRRLADSGLVAIGFREREVSSRVERFGNVAHVWTQYESYRFDEATPFMRGINSIQLLWDGARWWILSVFWDNDRPGNPLLPPRQPDPHE